MVRAVLRAREGGCSGSGGECRTARVPQSQRRHPLEYIKIGLSQLEEGYSEVNCGGISGSTRGLYDSARLLEFVQATKQNRLSGLQQAELSSLERGIYRTQIGFCLDRATELLSQPYEVRPFADIRSSIDSARAAAQNTEGGFTEQEKQKLKEVLQLATERAKTDFATAMNNLGPEKPDLNRADRQLFEVMDCLINELVSR